MSEFYGIPRLSVIDNKMLTMDCHCQFLSLTDLCINIYCCLYAIIGVSVCYDRD